MEAPEARGGKGSAGLQAMLLLLRLSGEAELSRGWGRTVTAGPGQAQSQAVGWTGLRPQQVSGPWADISLGLEQGSLGTCPCEAASLAWFLPIQFSCPNQ